MRRHVVPLIALVALASCAGRTADVRRVDMEIARTPNGAVPPDVPPEPPPRSELQATIDGICELTSGIVRCAGRNMWGEVGDGTREPHPDWARVPGTAGAVQLAAGGQHVCVRIKDGTARCWGKNEFAQLGDGVGGEPLLAPVEVATLGEIDDLRAGAFHTCARVRKGDVLCWGGKIDSVQIAFDLDPKSRLHPTRMTRAATQLVVGHERTYAKTPSGWVTWAPKRGAAPIPRELPELADAVDIAAGWTDECAVTAAGEVRCWHASHPSTGSNALDPEAAKLIQKLPPATRVAIGDRQACALLKDGRVFCWGQLFGHLRVPAPPEAVEGIADAIDVTAGFGFTCARLRSGAVKCWGSTAFLPGETAIGR